MENFEFLIEKYKNDLLQLASRAIKQINDENIVYVTQQRENEDSSSATDNEREIADEAVFETPTAYSDGKGSLKISVYTGDEAFPVMSALVQVFNGEKLVFQEFTDLSGSVDEIYLPAPSRTISESPGNSGGYATYKVVVSHPRFNTVIFEDVPVFDGAESVQPVAMEPRNINGITVVEETEPDLIRRVDNA